MLFPEYWSCLISSTFIISKCKKTYSYYEYLSEFFHFEKVKSKKVELFFDFSACFCNSVNAWKDPVSIKIVSLLTRNLVLSCVQRVINCVSKRAFFCTLGSSETQSKISCVGKIICPFCKRYCLIGFLVYNAFIELNICVKKRIKICVPLIIHSW